MSEIEKAKLFDVTGPADKPKQQGNGIAVQFNPSSLKVTLANSIKENERSGTSRATQYVDKSSSSLTVELIFDTTLEWEKATEKTPDRHKDVRLLTKVIAEAYMHQKKVGDKKTPPKRCMFVWGTFAFVGVMESFDETLDFFAPEGTPLRATVSLKMTESRFQFETRAAQAASRDTPQLGTGSDPVESNWRDKAMYNGTESPRMPESSALSMPSVSASNSLTSGFSKPSFSVGSSSSLGTAIPGAFSVTSSAPIRPPGLSVTSSSPVPVKAKAAIGFD
ncbi:MAG TPA: hypothetical protein VN030_03305 [Cellvibrio sp.]|nr:hypothetical protein [Cellvibrio sp.]